MIFKMRSVVLMLVMIFIQLKQCSPLGDLNPDKVTVHVWRGENMLKYGDDGKHNSHAPFMYTIYQPVAKYKMEKNKGNLHKAHTENHEEYFPFDIEHKGLSSEDFIDIGDHVPSDQILHEVINTEEKKPQKGRRVCECYLKYDDEPYRSRNTRHSYRKIQYPRRFQRNKKRQKYEESKLTFVKYRRPRPKYNSRKKYGRYLDERPYGRFSGYSPNQERYKRQNYAYNTT